MRDQGTSGMAVSARKVANWLAPVAKTTGSTSWLAGKRRRLAAATVAAAWPNAAALG